MRGRGGCSIPLTQKNSYLLKIIKFSPNPEIRGVGMGVGGGGVVVVSVPITAIFDITLLIFNISLFSFQFLWFYRKCVNLRKIHVCYEKKGGGAAPFLMLYA